MNHTKIRINPLICLPSYRGVEAKRDEHEKEDDGEETARLQVRDRLGVHDED